MASTEVLVTRAPDVIKLPFGSSDISIASAPPGMKINVEPRLIDRAGFKGSPLVDHVVDFGGAYCDLIGTVDDKVTQEILEHRGAVVLEHHSDEARRIMDGISGLARRVIAEPGLYDDKTFGAEYYALAKEGYDLLRKHAPEFGLDLNGGIPVSLVRAGLITTRLAYGEHKNAVMPDEVQVVTKRTHLIGENPGDLTVTVKFDDRGEIPQRFDGKNVVFCDFVNFHSGRS